MLQKLPACCFSLHLLPLALAVIPTGREESACLVSANQVVTRLVVFPLADFESTSFGRFLNATRLQLADYAQCYFQGIPHLTSCTVGRFLTSLRSIRKDGVLLVGKGG